MNKLRFWCSNARDIALPQSILPALVATAIAARYDGFAWWLALAAIAGIALAHLGMNLADDYFDYKHDKADVRHKMNLQGMRARIGKCEYLLSGQVTVNQLVTAIIVFLTLAGSIGIVIASYRGIYIVLYAVVALFLGISYSGFPFRLAYHGLGELVIGLMFGPLLMTGMQYAANGTITADNIVVSVAIGSLVVNIIFAHSILDADADRFAGKKTMAIMLKSKSLIFANVLILNVLPFVIIVIGVLVGVLHPAYLSVFAVMHLSVYLTRSLRVFLYGGTMSLQPRRWMGPMTQWSDIRRAGIDWFMIRWLVARNLMSFFALIIIIVNVILLIIN